MPAVRPVPVPPGSGPAQQKPPIESRSFDSLLDDARQTEPDTETAGDRDGGTRAQATEPPAPDNARPTISPLSGIDSIHNASLRRIIADAADGR